MPKPDYPGKPGPKPTGLTRPITFPFAVTDEEYEYLFRASRQKFGGERKIGMLLRSKVFPRTWHKQLADLRTQQGGDVR